MATKKVTTPVGDGAGAATTPDAPPVAVCLTPECGKPGRTRGLCSRCYTVARRLVKDGRTTWDALEAKGRVSKPARSRGKEAVESFLLGE